MYIFGIVEEHKHLPPSEGALGFLESRDVGHCENGQGKAIQAFVTLMLLFKVLVPFLLVLQLQSFTGREGKIIFQCLHSHSIPGSFAAWLSLLQ